MRRRLRITGEVEAAIRAELEARIVRLAVDQDEVGPDVAIAVIVPLAAERVIEIPARQGVVLRQRVDGFEQQGIEASGVRSGFLASLVTASRRKRLVYLTIRIQARKPASPAAKLPSLSSRKDEIDVYQH